MRTLICLSLACLLLAGCATKKEKAGFVITEEHHQLAERALEAQETAEGTPAKEALNRLNSRDMKYWLQQLQGEKPPQGLQSWKINQFRSLIETAKKGQDWPIPEDARVPYVGQPPKIDGKLDDPAWKNAWSVTGAYEFNTQSTVDAPPTTWKMAWDEKNLYVAWDCVDHDLVAPTYERDGAVYSADCVEIFICPEILYRSYIELIISPSNSIFDAYHTKNLDLWGASADTKSNLRGMQVGLVNRGTVRSHLDEDAKDAEHDVDEGYTVEVAIPFSALPEYSRAEPKVGHRLHFIMARLDRNAGPTRNWAYKPLLSWGHNIWNHGEMVLVK